MKEGTSKSAGQPQSHRPFLMEWGGGGGRHLGLQVSLTFFQLMKAGGGGGGGPSLQVCLAVTQTFFNVISNKCLCSGTITSMSFQISASLFRYCDFNVVFQISVSLFRYRDFHVIFQISVSLFRYRDFHVISNKCLFVQVP